ncbi:hypothetical protein [Enterococcus pallens]|uniref:Uncharacterized protein n=1 Tax=Enterococcus pallens ATCC BAA-351 TaxID=1158607 RepID=R2QMD5_9ENTE|nr:hypothetical protein [Enterococcus pallens]EOH97732.1 hypothetical protein UAU_00400 [Enterococcus pallens ATCC BAA-351]EOU20849.1 hypothetical protein I588_01696 [Enterococcus pallens ATCC BAA-351]
MKTLQEKIEWYTFWYWVYWLFSLVVLLGVVVLGIFFYFTDFQEVVTVSQLFLLLLLMLLAIYLRMTALHYHSTLQDLKRMARPRRKPRGQPERRRSDEG